MEFKKLFEEFGWTVEQVGEKSFIANKGEISIGYTEFVSGSMSLLAGVSVLATPEQIKEAYKEYRHYGMEHLGHSMFSDWMNNHLEFTRAGGVCNHDHSLYEVRMWLEYTTR